MKTKMIIKDQKGGALIEFAIVLPLLVLLVIGIIEFGLLCYNKHIIVNASREGARTGIIQGTTESEIKTMVKDYCIDRLITFDNSFSVLPDGWITINDGSSINTNFQAPLKVYVRYDYTFLVASLFGLGPTNTITAQTEMKMEQIVPGT